MMKDWKTIVIIAVGTLFFFSHGMGARPLWEFDEAKHAQVAKEMIVKGDWITPTFNGIPFYNKPILHFWMVAASFSILGINEFAARFPSAILGVGGVILVFLWARRIYGSRIIAILSSLILATSVEYIILSQNVIHDMSLAFFINLCLFLFHTSYKNQCVSKVSLALFCASLGCAVLAKGPVGVLLVFLIIGTFLLVNRKGGFLINKNLLWGVLISMLVALPWYISMIVRNPGYFKSFLIEGQLNRFFSSAVVHQEPLYYYLPVIIIGFFPWIAFIPAAFAHHIRRYLNDRSEDSLYLLIAALVPVVFFSLSHSKLPTYVLPVFPALSMVAGAFWSYGMNDEGRQKWKKHLIYSCLFLSAILFVAFTVGIIFINTRYPYYLIKGIPLIIILMASALGISLAAWKKKLPFAYSIIAGMMFISMLYSTHSIMPLISPSKSPKDLSLRMKALIPPDKPVVFYPRLREPVVYYSDRHALIIRTKEGMDQFFRSGERVFCVMSMGDYEKLKKHLTTQTYLIDQQGYVVVVSNKQSLES